MAMLLVVVVMMMMAVVVVVVMVMVIGRPGDAAELGEAKRRRNEQRRACFEARYGESEGWDENRFRRVKSEADSLTRKVVESGGDWMRECFHFGRFWQFGTSTFRPSRMKGKRETESYSWGSPSALSTYPYVCYNAIYATL